MKTGGILSDYLITFIGIILPEYADLFYQRSVKFRAFQTWIRRYEITQSIKAHHHRITSLSRTFQLRHFFQQWKFCILTIHDLILNLIRTAQVILQIEISRCVCETLTMPPAATKSKKAIFRAKVKVKATRSLTLVSLERASLVKYACQI